MGKYQKKIFQSPPTSFGLQIFLGLRIDGGLLDRLHQLLRFFIEVAAKDPGFGGAIGVPAEPPDARNVGPQGVWKVAMENGH